MAASFRDGARGATTKAQVPAVKDILDFRDAKGLAPLTIAAANGSSKGVQSLLGKGASPWAADLNGFTPLHWAASAGHAGVAKMLLESASARNIRANYVDVVCKFGLTPLHCAVARGQPSTVAVLLRHRANLGARGHTLEASKLADFNIPCLAGAYATPMHIAALRNNVPVVRLLLSYYLENLLVRAKSSMHDPRLQRNGSSQRPIDLLPSPPATAGMGIASGAAECDLRMQQLLEPSCCLTSLLPEVARAAVAIHGHHRIDGVVPTLQMLAAAVLAKKLNLAVTAAAAAAAAKATAAVAPPQPSTPQQQGHKSERPQTPSGLGTLAKAGLERPRTPSGGILAKAGVERPPTPAMPSPRQSGERPSTPSGSSRSLGSERPATPSIPSPRQATEQRPPTSSAPSPRHSREQRPSTSSAPAPRPAFEQRPSTPSASSPRPASEQRPPTPSGSSRSLLAQRMSTRGTPSPQHAPDLPSSSSVPSLRQSTNRPPTRSASSRTLSEERPSTASVRLLRQASDRPSTSTLPDSSSSQPAGRPSTPAAPSPRQATERPPLPVSSSRTLSLDRPSTPSAPFPSPRTATARPSAPSTSSRTLTLDLPLPSPRTPGRPTGGGPGTVVPLSKPPLPPSPGPLSKPPLPRPRTPPAPFADPALAAVALSAATGSGGGSSAAASVPPASSVASVSSESLSSANSSSGSRPDSAKSQGSTHSLSSCASASIIACVLEEPPAACGICMTEPPVVRSSSCTHGMCGSCVKQLCRMVPGRLMPLQCPFCRTTVEDFIPLV